MNPEELQQDMTPDESAAVLSLITEMSQGLMPQAPQDDAQGSIIAPGEEMPQKQGNMAQKKKEPTVEPDNDEEMGEELESIKDEIASLRDEIKEALSETSEETEEEKADGQ